VKRRRLLHCLVLALLPMVSSAQGFDHAHAAWDTLLQKHVKLVAGGNASQVNYKGFAADRAQLKAYLDSLSAVSGADFGKWSKAQQYAFLGNAYNAFTIEKILTRYPDIRSIRDFGRVIGNPWKDRFFKLLGKDQHLDGIEHETMRAPGAFDDPRVHVAVNCASIGCPMLGNRALVADQLDAQLDTLFRRFMSDRSRNRYNAQAKTVEVSSIFDWYKADFEKGHRGFTKVEDVFARYANELADNEADRAALRAKSVPYKYLEYDWSLNDVR
jgi:Skp family chaperone for outer membrane proteins